MSLLRLPGRVPALILAAAGTILAQGPLMLTSMDPFTAAAGTQGLSITVSGTGFQSGAAVHFGSQPVSTSFTSSERLSASIPTSLLATSGQVPVFVVNPGGNRSNPFLFTIVPAALSIVTESLPDGVRQARYTQTLAATGGTLPYFWSVAGSLPTGLNLSSAGELSGTPSVAGTFSVQIRVTDNAGRVVLRALPLMIAPPPLSITSPAEIPSAMEGSAYSYALMASDGSGTLQWSASTSLPQGLSLSPQGALSGVPAARGTYRFTVQVTDGASGSASKVLTLVVRPAVLTITTASPLSPGSEGTAYSQTFTVAGGTSPYSWSMRSPVPGLQLDSATGILSGTPQQAGSYGFAMQVTDASGATFLKEFSLTVEQPRLRISTASPLPPGKAGTPYQQTLTAAGGQPPYIWSLLSSSAASAAIDAKTGILSLAEEDPGNITLHLAVSDSSGFRIAHSFLLSMAPAELKISAGSGVLSAVAGEAFRYSFSVSGGVRPYQWEVQGVPEGMALQADGSLAGTLRTIGSFPLVVRLTDAAGSSTAGVFRLEVSPPAPPALLLSGVNETAPAASQLIAALQLAKTYPLPLLGQLLITFTPDHGLGDPAVQFLSGGRTLDFRAAAGAQTAEFAAMPAGLQTGTVAGVIQIHYRLQTMGTSLTPAPVLLQSARVEPSAPVITAATVSRGTDALEFRLTGYSTTREMTQAVFRFRAANGSALASGEITLPLEESFGRWFQDAASGAYGGQFTFAQQFRIQGDGNAVQPVSVTLANRNGSTTFPFE